MKYKIINFYPGAKGEFLVNFLNDKSEFIGNGQSYTGSGSGKKESNFANTISLNQLDLYVDLLLETNFDTSFIVSHFLKLLDDENLDRLSKKYDLYHISIDNDWCKQVNIDAVFKMYTRSIAESLYIAYEKKFSLDDNTQYFNIDTRLLDNNLNINNTNRIDELYNFINHNVYYDNQNSKIKNIYYSELFSPTFKGTEFLCNQINKNFDPQLFQSKLSESFLPKTITVFDCTFNVEELGYRYYI